MNTQTTPAPAPDDPPPMPVEVEVIVENGQASLVLIAADQSALEVPLSRNDCISLAVSLLEFAYPGARLRSTPPAGSA